MAGTLVTSTAAELNYVDVTAGTAAASKAMVLDADKGITGVSTLTASYFSGDGSGLTNVGTPQGSNTQVQFNQNGEFAGDSGLVYDGSGSLDLVEFAAGSIGLKLAGTLVTSTAAELNLLDTAAAGTVVNSKAVIYSAAGVVQGTDFKGPDGFDIGNASVTDMIKLNAAEVVFKDGNLTVDIASADAASYGLKLAGTLITSTAAELNLIDGSSAGTVVNSKAAIYDGGGHLNGTQLSSSFGISGSALTLGGTAVGASANDLNLAQGMAQSTGTALGSAFIALDEDKSVTGIQNLTASYFSGNGSGITNIDVSNLDAAGSNTQLQFNQNGEFAGDSGLVYDGSGSLDLVEFAAGSIGLKLGGVLVTATAAELNYVDIATLGTAAASKALTIKGDSTWTVAGMTCADIGTVTTIDLNGGTIDGATIGVSSAAVVTASYLAVNGNVDLGDGSDIINVNGRLDFGGGASANMQHVTSNDTLAEGDFYNIVSGSGAVTVTLPGNSGLTDGTIFYIKRGYGMTNDVTVAVADDAAEMLDGESSIVLESALAAVQLFWDSTAANWNVF